VPLHHADAVADHEPAGGLLGDCSREHGAGQESISKIVDLEPGAGDQKLPVMPPQVCRLFRLWVI
jgi:hypothetical protein